MTRILLVDDLTLICEILQTRLEAENDFQVVGSANSGHKAIQQVEKLQPDIVLMDIEMPGMDGLSATKIIKERFPQTKIIVLTGNSDADFLAKSLKAGAQGYLVKTNKVEDIANTIRFVERGNHQIEPTLLKEIVAKLPASENIDIEAPVPNKSTIEQKLIHNGILEDKTIAPEIKDLSAPVTDYSALNGRSLLSPLVNKSLKAKPVRSKLVWGTATVLILGSLVLLSGRLRPSVLLGSSNASDEPANSQAKSTYTANQNALPVETVSVTNVDSYQESRFYTGTIVPRRTSEMEFEHPGKIIRIAVREGDRVAAGTPMAYLDSRELEATENELQARRSQAVAKLEEMQAGPRSQTIAAAKAQVRDSRQQLELASLKSNRRKALYAEGAISREQLDENISNKQAIQARLDEAQSQLNELLAGTRSEQINAQKSSIQQIDASLAKLRIQLEKTVVKAPFTAIVARKLVDEGTVVDANQPVLRLVENKALEARIGVPVDIAEQISLGSLQQLKIGQKTYEAKVTSFLPEVDFNTRTVTAVLSLNKSISEILPGQVAKLKLNSEVDTSGYWLPTTALAQGGRGLWYCYALGEPAPNDGNNNAFYVTKQDLEVLYTEGDRVLVRGTISSGDRVISSGTHRIAVGQLVTPIKSRS